MAEEGVAGEDFWKNPRIDFWFFMFWVLDVVRLSAVEGGVPVGDDASALAMVNHFFGIQLGYLGVIEGKCSDLLGYSIEWWREW